MKSILSLLALCAALLPGLGQAHCTKDAIVGTWEARAAGGGSASSLVVWFTAEQKAAFSGVFSAAGSTPAPLDLPLSNYDLGWKPAPVSTSNGVCVIIATWTIDGVRQDVTLLWPADTKKPTALFGVDAVTGAGKPFTMQISLTRRPGQGK